MSPTVVPSILFYVGDTCHFPTYTFMNGDAPSDLEAEGWTDWAATWREYPSDPKSIALVVDTSKSSSGIIAVTATAEQTSNIRTEGVWDLQAKRSGEVKTFLRGSTTYMLDVTRD